MKKYDLVVIGGGPAGTPVVMEFAKLNPEKKVLLVDAHGELGGECLFDGCIPSKIMQITAKYIQQLRNLEEFGIVLESKHYRVAWEKIVARKKSILSQRTAAAKETLLRLTNATLLKATAKFLDDKHLEVLKDDGSVEKIEFLKAVIATGSQPRELSYAGGANEHIWTNEDFFEKMELPESMSIIGGGAIAVEFAQILSLLGCKIKLFVRSNRILKNLEEEAASFIFQTLQRNENIELIVNATVEKISFENEFSITYKQDGTLKVAESQRVLSAIGRVANVASLELENTAVELSNGSITTDKHLQTSNANIYANGDVVSGFPKFAHTSQYGAHTIAQNLFLEHNLLSVNFDKNSWVLFSEPNVAMAGISRAQADKRGIEVLVEKYAFSTDAKAQIEANDKGYLEFVVEKKSRKIIGITIVAYEANSIAGEAALIVANELSLSDLISTIHPHPTLSESFTVLAKMMMGKIMQEKLQKPFVKTLLKIERFL